MSRFLVLTVLLCSLLLTACGGGGGSGSDVPGLGDPGSGGTDFTISTTSLSFTSGIDEGAPAAQTITLHANSSEVEEPYVSYPYQSFIEDCLTTYPDDRTMVVTVTVKPPEELAIGTYTADVVIENSTDSRTITVTYTVTGPPPGAPLVNFVSPHPVMADTSSDVIIRGSGFSRFNEVTLPAVSFGGNAGSNIRVLSDTEIRATTPALPAGTHAVNLSGAGTEFISTAELLVVAPQTFTTTNIATSGEKSKLIYDAQYNELFVVNTTSGQLERYSFQSGTAWTLDTLSLPGVLDAAMAPDAKTLVAIDGSGFYEIDPHAAALSAGTRVDAPFESPYDEIAQVAFANDGKALAVAGDSWSEIWVYDLADQSTSYLTHLNSFYITVPYLVTSANLFEVADGSLVYLGETGSSVSRLYSYSASDQSVVETGPEESYAGFFSLAASRDLSVLVVNGDEIRDGELNLLSTLPQEATAATMTPDGTTVYSYDEDASILRAFDISDPTAPVRIGGDASLSPAAGSDTKMRISPDGNTLFMVGQEQLHIIDLTSFAF